MNYRVTFTLNQGFRDHFATTNAEYLAVAQAEYHIRLLAQYPSLLLFIEVTGYFKRSYFKEGSFKRFVVKAVHRFIKVVLFISDSVLASFNAF